MATSNGKVGPLTVADGAEHVLRTGKSGEQIVAQVHGRYYENTYRGNMFFSTCTAKTLTAANTTYTGHVIWNGSSQAGSGVNMVLNKIMLGVSVTSASMTGIALGYGVQAAIPTGLTAATVQGNLKLGGAAAQGLSYAAATLANASTNICPLMHNTAAINTVGVDQVYVDLEGSVIVPPGYHVAIVALGAASAASAVTSSIFWEEVPV